MSGISPQQKEGSSEKGWKRKKKGSKDWKAKEVKPHMKISMLQKIKWMKFTSCWERFYQKKERKEITFSYSAKSDVWPHPYPHIICICTIFNSLTFPFLTPITTSFSINHDYLPHKLFRIFFLLQYTRCSIGTSWEWTTTKILAERKRVTGRMSDWVIKLEKRGR